MEQPPGRRIPSLKEVNRWLTANTPHRVWSSTVPIFGTQRPTVGQIGTGILFQVADAHFLVTAGHVARRASKHRMTVAIGASPSRLVPLIGQWMCTDPSDPGDESSDLHDVAVKKLTADAVEKLLESNVFLHTSEIRDLDPGPRAVYCLFGYPGMWSAPSRSVSEQLRVKPLEHVTYTHNGDVVALRYYDRKLHILLAGGPEDLSDDDGLPVEVRDRSGQPRLFPRALQGVSGCSVWHIGDTSVPLDQWAKDRARLIGIETSIYQAAGVIKVSRWRIVSTLIYEACPELRSAFKIWRPGRF
jgi:hypothetical protein